MRNFFKATCLMVMALLVINFTSNAEAIVVKLPSTGFCPSNLPPGTKCVGSYNLTDMGYFDAGGTGNWVPNAQFMETMEIANFNQTPTTAPVLRGLGPNWLNMITPTKSTTVNGHLDRRLYAPDSERALAGIPDEMRISFKVALSSEHVSVYLSECFAMRTHDDFGNPLPSPVEFSTTCGDHGTPVNPNVTRVEMFAMNKTGNPSVMDPLKTPSTVVPGAERTLNDIESVKWVERNLQGTPHVNDKQTYASISYNLVKRFWNSPQSPLTRETDLQYNWSPIPANLAENETATFEIKVKGLTDPFLAYTVIKSIDPMPIVLATYKSTEYNILKEKEKKSGKMVIKAEEVEVTRNNITVREVADPDGLGNALVIQWPEPDLALFGGRDFPLNSEYQVRVWVGASKRVGIDFFETFYFYDIPAQLGTCVVSGDFYDNLLEQLLLDGYLASDLRVRLSYRAVYNPPGMPSIPGKFTLQYQNRSMSAQVPINEQ